MAIPDQEHRERTGPLERGRNDVIEPENQPDAETRRAAVDRERRRIEGQSPVEAPSAEPESARSSGRPAVLSPAKDPLTASIEDVMSEDLEPLYRAMTPEQQLRFRAVGEETATTVRALLENVKVGAQTILDLLRKWLRLIPGVNKFFLEQEAKIKTDQIMAVHRRLHHRQ